MYSEKDGFLWKMSGALFYGLYKIMLDYERWRYRKHIENIDMEQAQLELLARILESK